MIKKLSSQNEINNKEKQFKINISMNEVSNLRDQMADLKLQNQILQQDVKLHQEQALFLLV